MFNLENKDIIDGKLQEQIYLNNNFHEPIFDLNEKNALVLKKMPWNSYWRTFEMSLDYLKSHSDGSPHKKEFQLLNFDNGARDNTIRFLQAGFTVTKFDIFKKNKISDTESLPFEDERFEVVVGIDILNYVNIKNSIIEIRRVLKKNGVAIFRVPVKIPLTDFSFLGRGQGARSRDYRAKYQLNSQDLKIIKSIFPDMSIERSNILSRLDYYLFEHCSEKISFFERCDYFLAKFIPGYGLLGGAAVLVLRNSPKC